MKCVGAKLVLLTLNLSSLREEFTATEGLNTRQVPLLIRYNLLPYVLAINVYRK